MNTLSSQRGFTLLETMVAVSLLMLSIVGPLTIAQKSVKTSTYTKNRTTAYYLAQDAIEFLRNIRDVHSLKGDTWDDLVGLSSPYARCIVGKCDVDTQYAPVGVVSNSALAATAVIACSSETCPALTFEKATGYFGHKTVTGEAIIESQYRREVSIVPLNTNGGERNRELLIRVDVIWNEGILGGEKKISLYDEVYDWQ